MRVNFYLSGNEVHDRVICAMYEGCPEEKKLIPNFQYQEADVGVVFGVRKKKVKLSWPRGEVYKLHQADGADMLVLETGYINRGDGEEHHYAAGLNGLNGRADFKNTNMPSDRWDALGVALKPYGTGSHIVLCGQVPWDASVDNTDIVMWCMTAALALKKVTDRPIIFRPHPLAPVARIEGCGYSQKPLAEDLKDAHALVTFNSNSGVEALIAGVPVFSFDEGSMVYDESAHEIADIERPIYPDRTQWANDIAFAQWTQQEMREGKAWRHLFGTA